MLDHRLCHGKRHESVSFADIRSFVTTLFRRSTCGGQRGQARVRVMRSDFERHLVHGHVGDGSPRPYRAFGTALARPGLTVTAISGSRRPGTPIES